MIYNNGQNFTNPYNMNYNYIIKRQQEIQKSIQLNSVKRTSMAMGFFATAYLVMMYVINFIYIGLIYAGPIPSVTNETLYIIEISISVGSALIPGLIFFIISRNNIFKFMNKTYVKPTKLVPMIMIGMGVAMIANFAANLFDQNISIFGLENHASLNSVAKTAPEIILYIISTAIVPAFAEEFAYRGIVLSSLRRFGDGFAIFCSALLFGAMHGNTTQIIFAFLVGLVFAFVDVKTNSIIPSVIIHFLNNFYAVITDILQTNDIFDKQFIYIIYFGLIVAFCVIGFLSFVYLTKSDKNAFVINDKTSETSLLSFSEKMHAFLLNPGVIIALSLFAAEVILYLLPQ